MIEQFRHEAIDFRYRESGSGLPVVFQHGLGGDSGAVFDLLAPSKGETAMPPGFRLLGFDFRAHGETRPLGPEEKVSIAAFAEDLLGFLDQMSVQRAVIGGSSMGAAVALNFALRFPERVAGLILSRVAWLAGPMEANAVIFAEIAALLRRYGAVEGFARFSEGATYQAVLRESPDAAESLATQFVHPRAVETVVKLERIPRDAPTRDPRDWGRVDVPTLVIANRRDPIHPFEFGETMAREIPHARLVEVPSKGEGRARFESAVRGAIRNFLTDNFSNHGGLTC